MKRVRRAILIALIVIVIGLNLPIVQFRHSVTETSYANWMAENLDNDDSITEIKMLGSHDSFSNSIHLFSEPDPYGDSIMQGFTGTILKGFLVRQSITQEDEVDVQLHSGVRYFDVRLSLIDDTWYTKHNYLSDEFENDIAPLIEFLETNPGEVVILDFQHIAGVDYSSSSDYDNYTDMLSELGLLDYSYYDTSNSLSGSTYGDITEDKSISRVLIIDKFDVDNKETYTYDKSIRSNWANMDEYDQVLSFLHEEGDEIDQDVSSSDMFRVMQAVTTMQLSPDGIINSLETWSLLERASEFNTMLIEEEEFESLLEQMPIVMVDNATFNGDDFVDDIMEIIIRLNN